MQQTNLDRLLRRKYVYVTHIYTNTLPHTVPTGVKVDETTSELGGMYLYRFTAKTDKQLNELTARLEVENITYTSRIADQPGIRDKLLNSEHQSFTIQMVWLFFIIAIVAVIFSGLPVYLWNTLSAEEPTEEEAGEPTESFFEKIEWPWQ